MAKSAEDPINRHLLSLLQANAREPLASLARKVGLSRNAVVERLKRLERNGVIGGYTVRVADGSPPAAVRAYLLLSLNGIVRQRVDAAIARLLEVKLGQKPGGEFDMLLYVETDSTGHLDRVSDELAGVHGVRKVTTSIMLSDRLDRR